ncbi:MAG: bifunctional 2-polyprenyl-6-hydroxyphenol methylase/3-demethylubiquinol 3-O-methyltransferase UbiG [Gluconacetobacter diazotrophicus]|nr:bifunctional 2-polyprenyl-6-hydroxyphenol methylase/3-demethylubiquinol 3-O-methyltransferase UbiG [Gluconacetobacter diazotrophicus]
MSGRETPSLSLSPSPTVPSGSARADEVARFGRLAGRWWDADGPMRVLHQMNPVRLGWVENHLRRRGGAEPGRPVRVLDVGCGAGIASEAMAAMGYEVLGIDASADAIAAARAHADRGGEAGGGRVKTDWSLRYAVGTPEALDPAEGGFDLVTAFEVVEHVAEVGAFLRSLAAQLRPGGLVALTTVNRTARSLLVAKIGAEYVAGLLPRGTHDWRRFPTPRELGDAAAGAGLRVLDVAGMVPDPRRGASAWRMSDRVDVNYAMLLGG